MFIELVSAVVGLIILYLSYRRYTNSYWTRKNVPLIEQHSDVHSNLAFQNHYADLKKQGHIHGGLQTHGGPLYVPADLDLIKNILIKDFQHFTGHGMEYDAKRDPLSAHIFNLDGEEWRNIRVKLSPTFTSGKMKMMFDTLLDCGIPMIEHIDQLCKNRQPLNLKTVLASYTTDVIGSCAFGIECNSFKNPDSEFLRIGHKIFGPRPRPPYIFTLMPILKRKFSPIDKSIFHFFMNLIKDIMDHRKNNKIVRSDFIHLFMDIQEKAKQTGRGGFTLEEIVAQSFVFFLAGFETSSSTMSFCLHELAFNQDIQDKARKEVKETIKKHDGKLTYEAVMEMKYLDQVVNEAIRKYPIVPILLRMCTKDYKVPNTNVTIEKGTRAFISVLGVHRDEEYYPNAERFDPERFTEENKAKRPAIAFLPFGEGPRICLGMRFGLMQTKTALSMLLNKYRFTPANGDKYKIDFEPKTFNLTKAGKMEVVPEII